METETMKPLGQKVYGHIPHFIGSRMTPMDKHCEPGQQKIMTQKVRDRNDLIIVQEKLDGGNVGVAKLNGEILALTRAGYLAKTSPFIQFHYFDNWVKINEPRFNNLLNEGERLVGEWLIQACGTLYDLDHEPFVPFDIMVKHDRLNYHDFILRVLPLGFMIPRLLHIGQHFKIESAKEMISISGHGADQVEGFVYRCERNRKVDFLCKWVRPDKIDGKYLPEISGEDPIWNCPIDEFENLIRK